MRVDLAPGIAIIHGSMVDVLPTLPPVDHTIMDPPYEDAMHDAKMRRQKVRVSTRSDPKATRGAKIRTDGGRDIPPLNFKSITSLRPVITKPLVEMTKGWLIAFCTPEGITPWRDEIELAGANYKRALFWVKPDSAPQFNGQGPAMAVECMVAAWCGGGVSRWNGGGSRNYYTELTNQPDRHGEHPTEKPVKLMMKLLTQFTSPGDLILDPFVGSGTTGIACWKTGRRFIGIEDNDRYFDLACERVSMAIDQGDIFTPPAPRPVQNQMFDKKGEIL